MIRHLKKASLIFLVLLFTINILAGCKKKDATNVETDKVAAIDKLTLPITDKPITLKYWIPFSSTIIKTLDENVVYQELEKRTGIKMQFIHPPAGQENEQFNLMIASNDLPDILQNAPGYPGGPDKAIEDKVYLKLNDLIDKYAPNYKALRASNNEIARQTITDSGNIYGFACIQLTEEQPWAGPIIRNDWLKELNLQTPTTIDEWYKVLKAFKEKKNVEAPLLFTTNWLLGTSMTFVGAYDVTNDFFNENGKVKYGPIEPGYKEFLTTMNKWYKEGLIDKDFATRDGKSTDAMFTSGKAGAMFQAYGSFGPYIVTGQKNDPKFELAPTPLPTKEPGQKLHFRQTNFYNKGSYGIVTTACKYPVEAVKWLDYGYTDEGHLLYCYGIEGLTWKWVDGPPGFDKDFYPPNLRNQNRHPEFTEFMTKNPDGLDIWDLVPKYKVHQTAYLRNPMAYGKFRKEIIDCMETWQKAGNDYVMPQTTMTDEETRKFSSIMNEVNTFFNEMQLKFIMGIEPLSKYDDFVTQLKNMGIEDAIKIKQASLDRYNKR